VEGQVVRKGSTPQVSTDYTVDYRYSALVDSICRASALSNNLKCGTWGRRRCGPLVEGLPNVEGPTDTSRLRRRQYVP